MNGDAWSDLLPAIARHLLGDPPAIEAGGTWRYGKRGSLAVHVDGPRRGTFRDFEAGKSGGVLDLVLHLVEHVNDRAAAAAWLRAEGLAPHGPQTPVKRRTPAHPSRNPTPTASASETTRTAGRWPMRGVSGQRPCRPATATRCGATWSGVGAGRRRSPCRIVCTGCRCRLPRSRPGACLTARRAELLELLASVKT